MYEFEVEGKIVGKERPRINTYTCRAYTPTKTKDYEELIQQYFLLKYPRYKTLEGRVKVTIIAFFNVPKNTNKENVEKMLQGEISPTKKPDIDNIVKSILDALNKIVFNDDNQITKIEVEKRYALKDKVYVKIEEY